MDKLLEKGAQKIMEAMTREDYLAATKAEIKELDIKLGDKPVLIRAMSVEHNDQVKDRMMQTCKVTKNAATGQNESSPPSVAGLTAFVLVRSLCDPDGNLLFDPKSEKDLMLFEQMPGKKMRAIFDEAWAWSGWEDDVVDGLEKNSETTV